MSGNQTKEGMEYQIKFDRGVVFGRVWTLGPKHYIIGNTVFEDPFDLLDRKNFKDGESYGYASLLLELPFERFRSKLICNGFVYEHSAR